MGPCIIMLQHEVMVVDEWHNNGPQDLVTVRRRYWIHPIVMRREEHGEFYRLVQELKMYHERFRGYFRMSISEFKNLLQQLAPSLTKGSLADKRTHTLP